MTSVERQRWVRIRLSLAAYAYELLNESIMSDPDYDRMCLEVDTSISTGNRKLDNFFKKHFSPATGMWVRDHPEKGKLRAILKRFYGI